jgi:flagellar biosynthesis/type III secretory pathway M-ring protein FliF/YscJ
MAPLATPALPLHTAGKYVAAAYIVFVVLIVLYVAIMAMRLRRMERSIAELDERAALEQELGIDVAAHSTDGLVDDDEPVTLEPGARAPTAQS